MAKTIRITRIVCAALLLAALVGLASSASQAQAQSGESSASGPTSKDCFSSAYHAASDCDRLAAGVVEASAGMPVTGTKGFGPGVANCFSEAFHAASDCDRLVSGDGTVVSGESK